MHIKAKWHKEIELTEKYNLIYWADNKNIPTKAGCYVFFNLHGEKYRPIYIGQAKNLKVRIEQQFTTNVPLMMGIKNFTKGAKYLMFCEIHGNSKARLNKLESQLIKAATIEGHQLLNIKGTKRVFKDEIDFTGNRHSENMFGRKMYV